MTDFAPRAAVPASRRLPLVLINVGVNLALLAAVIVPILAIDWRRFSAAWSQASMPDLAVLAAAPPLVLAHLIAVVAALLLTLALLVGRKGTLLHRALGWTWSALLGAGAFSGLFIHQIGGWSFFHAYSAIALVLLPLSLVAARTHRVRIHAALMVYLAVNVLLGAGFFALYPGFEGRLLVRAIFP
jgi:uncharacterized membrane protein